MAKYTITEKGGDINMFRLTEDKIERALSFSGSAASAAFFAAFAIAFNTYQLLQGALSEIQRIEYQSQFGLKTFLLDLKIYN